MSSGRPAQLHHQLVVIVTVNSIESTHTNLDTYAGTIKLGYDPLPCVRRVSSVPALNETALDCLRRQTLPGLRRLNQRSTQTLGCGKGGRHTRDV